MPLIAAHELAPNSGSMQAYNALDCMLTFEVHGALARLSNPNADLIYDFERALQAPALEMMLRGFRVDPLARQSEVDKTRMRLGAVDRVLSAIVPALTDLPYNAKFPNSQTQLREFFYEILCLKPIHMSVKGELKTPMDRKVLERLEDYFIARPFVNAILLHRDLSKTLQVLETEIDTDWRWRCSYNIAGTSTGRWSSSKSGIGTGNNFQNITDELRRIFIPDEGFKLYGIDLEQAEAREVGWFCGTILGDWSYLDMIESGDPHTFVARLCWPELPWSGDLKKDRAIAERKFYRHFTYRDATKRLSHGSNYLGTPPTMASHTKIPLPIVRKFQERYFDSFSCIRKMHTYIAGELQTSGHLTNAFGRRRDFFDRANSDETLRAAVAFMFQSATGDRLNLGLWRIWKHMGLRVQLLAQLHDALYFQAREDDDERDVITQALALMDVPLRAPNGRLFTVPAEPVGGWNWAHRFQLDEEGNRVDWNPRGLDRIHI